MKMKESDWADILHFNKSEAWGDYTKLDKQLIINLDQMRELCGKPIVIHCAYELSGHTTTSQHYKGLAVDYHIVGMKLIDQLMLTIKFGWTSFGVYPDWNSPGIHADLRKTEIKKMWGAKYIINENTGKKENNYVALDEHFFSYIIAKDV